jgi:hypothetical protein
MVTIAASIAAFASEHESQPLENILVDALNRLAVALGTHMLSHGYVSRVRAPPGHLPFLPRGLGCPLNWLEDYYSDAQIPRQAGRCIAQ